MSTIVEQALSALYNLPADRRDELARGIIDATLPTIPFSDEELERVDRAAAAARAGDFADAADVEAVFARYR